MSYTLIFEHCQNHSINLQKIHVWLQFLKIVFTNKPAMIFGLPPLHVWEIIWKKNHGGLFGWPEFCNKYLWLCSNNILQNMQSIDNTSMFLKYALENLALTLFTQKEKKSPSVFSQNCSIYLVFTEIYRFFPTNLQNLPIFSTNK